MKGWSVAGVIIAVIFGLVSVFSIIASNDYSKVVSNTSSYSEPLSQWFGFITNRWFQFATTAGVFGYIGFRFGSQRTKLNSEPMVEALPKVYRGQVIERVSGKLPAAVKPMPVTTVIFAIEQLVKGVNSKDRLDDEVLRSYAARVQMENPAWHSDRIKTQRKTFMTMISQAMAQHPTVRSVNPDGTIVSDEKRKALLNNINGLSVAIIAQLRDYQNANGVR